MAIASCMLIIYLLFLLFLYYLYLLPLYLLPFSCPSPTLLLSLASFSYPEWSLTLKRIAYHKGTALISSNDFRDFRFQQAKRSMHFPSVGQVAAIFAEILPLIWADRSDQFFARPCPERFTEINLAHSG